MLDRFVNAACLVLTEFATDIYLFNSATYRVSKGCRLWEQRSYETEKVARSLRWEVSTRQWKEKHEVFPGNGEIRGWPWRCTWWVWVPWGPGEEIMNCNEFFYVSFLCRHLCKAPRPPPQSLASSRRPARRRPPYWPTTPHQACPRLDLQTQRPRHPLLLLVWDMICRNRHLRHPLSLSPCILWRCKTNRTINPF